MRKVRIVTPPNALKAMVSSADPSMAFAAFFSTKGSRSLADMLSGGDFDGDEYLLFLDSYKMVPLVGGLGTAPQLPESQDEESEEAGRMAYSQQVVMMPDVDGNGRPSDASDQPTPDKPQPQAMSLYEAFKRESVPYLALPTAAGAAKPPIVPRDPEEASKAFKKHYEDALLGNNKIGRSSNLIMLAQEHWGCGDPKTEVWCASTIRLLTRASLAKGWRGRGPWSRSSRRWGGRRIFRLVAAVGKSPTAGDVQLGARSDVGTAMWMRAMLRAAFRLTRT